MMNPMSQRSIRMRIETDDPLHYGKKKLKMRGRDLHHLPKAVFKIMDLEVCQDYNLEMHFLLNQLISYLG